MIFVILFLFGTILLLWSAIVIAYHLIKLAVLLVAWVGCLLAVIVTGSWYLGDKLLRYLRGAPSESEPMITINITLDDDDASIIDDDDSSIIELPRRAFRRLHG
jgi:hypothetical protein